MIQIKTRGHNLINIKGNGSNGAGVMNFPTKERDTNERIVYTDYYIYSEFYNELVLGDNSGDNNPTNCSVHGKVGYNKSNTPHQYKNVIKISFSKSITFKN